MQTYLHHHYYSFFVLVTDSPMNSVNPNQRKTKSNIIDNCQQTKSCQNMKYTISPKQMINSTTKHIVPDYSDMERNNIYIETTPKTQNNSSISPTTLVNGTNHYMPLFQQRRTLNNPNRNDNIRILNGTSMSSFSTTTTTCSSQSTTPSNLFRHDTTSIMTRSADASSSSSSCGLPTKNGTNKTMKSKSTYDIDLSTIDRSRQQTKDNLNNNSKCLNMITNGNFVPLQSVKEDECLEVNHDRCLTVKIIIFLKYALFFFLFGMEMKKRRSKSLVY